MTHSFAASFPPLTLADLLRADLIAIGRFSNAGGKIEFIAERMLKGDAVDAATRMQTQLEARNNFLTTAPDGGLTYRAADPDRWMVDEPADGRRSALWFLGTRRSTYGPPRQPLELADGFAALLENKDPKSFFRLMQQLHFDMQRNALEDLHANPDNDLIARLHSLALQGDSDLRSQAFTVLDQTRLLDYDLIWGKWTTLPRSWPLQEALKKRDAARMIANLKPAILAEKDPNRLAELLSMIPSDSPHQVELILPYLNHSSDPVRKRAIEAIQNVLWNLNAKAVASPEMKVELTALGERLVPLLDQQLKVETDPDSKNTLTKMLARVDGIPWILRIPQEPLEKPIPPYSEEAEFELVIKQLTSQSHGDDGFVMESAGREIAEHFFDKGFDHLSAAAASSYYKSNSVYESMGYVRDQRIFDYLEDHMTTINVEQGTFGSTLRALGVQNNPRSLDAIKRLNTQVDARQFDGLAVLSDRGTLPYLKKLRSRVSDQAQIPYLRALAMHGDTWAINELLAAMQKPPPTKFLTKGHWDPEKVIFALCSVDTPESTEVLKQYVVRSWPKRSYWYGFFRDGMSLQNYAGTSRRRAPEGEVARRDPQWLATFALHMMADDSLVARQYAADVFQQLTGQLGEYQPKDFARDRVQPLKKLEAWWSTNKSKSRERWLIDYFNGKGFAVKRLNKKSLPVLMQALEGDFFTHSLAVEQISAICQKYFTDFRYDDSIQAQKQMNVRVIGWLQARGHLNPEKSNAPMILMLMFTAGAIAYFTHRALLSRAKA